MKHNMVIMYGGEDFPGKIERDLKEMGYLTFASYFNVVRHTKARTKTIKRWIKEDEG